MQITFFLKSLNGREELRLCDVRQAPQCIKIRMRANNSAKLKNATALWGEQLETCLCRGQKVGRHSVRLARLRVVPAKHLEEERVSPGGRYTPTYDLIRILRRRC